MGNGRADLGELQRTFFKRLSALRKTSRIGIDDIAITPVVDTWVKLLEWAERSQLSDDQVDSIVSSARDAAAHLEQYGDLVGEPKADALAGVRGHLEVFPAIFAELGGGPDEAADFERYRGFIARATEESQRSLSVMAYVTEKLGSVDEAVTEAKNSAAKAQAASALAEKSATEAATATLEQSFEATAKQNAISANWYRGGTLGALALAVGLGAYYVIINEAESSALDWADLVYRVAILSGLAAIAAYLGRQASHYRRIATWARGIEIQLKAFLGFVNEIKDPEAKQQMYALFGKRVLEAPPEGKTSSEDSVTNVFQPIIEQAARLGRTS